MISQNLFLGMDTDTAYPIRDNKKYFKLTNGEIVSNINGSGGMITNAKGNKIGFKFPDSIPRPSGKTWLPDETNKLYVKPILRIIGAFSVGEYLVVFANNDNDDDPATDSDAYNYTDMATCTSNVGYIWAFKYSGDTVVDASAGNVLSGTKHLIYYDKLNFSLNNPVSGVGNKENDSTIKIYFADGVNNLRQMNILESGLIDQPLSYIEAVNDVSQPEIIAYSKEDGSFNPGIVQYSAQMYNYGSTETAYFPQSNLINLSKSKVSLSNSASFQGSEYDKNTNTGKSVMVNISGIDDNFDFIKIVRLFYSTEYASPEITIIYDGSTPDATSMSIEDDGVISNGTISTAEFIASGGTIFKPKSLTTAKNRLVAAGITDTYFDVGFDARAYRFDNTLPASAVAKVYQSDLTYYNIHFDGSWDYTDSGGTTTTGSGFNLPDDIDAINPYDEGYKYNPSETNSGVFGGYGPNVRFKFSTLQLPIDESGLKSTSTSYRGHYVNKVSSGQEWSTLLNGSFKDNDSYGNYASDINASLLAAYQRMETYRFGIVFFDTRGRSSFAKWICDIRMPAPTDSDGNYISKDGSTGTLVNSKSYAITSYKPDSAKAYIETTYGNNLYLQFTVNNIPANASAFQIVRVPRKSEDKTILGAGLILPVASGWTNPESSSEDTSYYKPVTGMREYDTGTGTLPTDACSPTLGLADNFGTTDNFSAGDSAVFGSSPYALYPAIYSDALFNFITPEVSFNRTTPIPSKIWVHGKIVDTESVTGNSLILQKEWAPPDTTTCDSVAGTIEHPYEMLYKAAHIAPISTIDYFSVDNGIVSCTPTDEYLDLNTSDTYKHHIYWRQEDTSGSTKHAWHNAYAGSAFIGKATTTISSSLSAYSGYDIAYGYMYRDVVQYGGNTYAERLYNKYMPASGVMKVTPGTTLYNIDVFGGDTYIAMFEHQRVFMDNSTEARNMSCAYDDAVQRDKTQMNSVIFPVESSINIDWRTDRTYSRINKNAYLLSEDKGLHSLLDSSGNAIYLSQETDAYLLNYAYIKYNDFVKYFIKGLHFDEKPLNYDHRIIISNKKYDNESSDSWLKFLVNNYTDVEGTYGPINDIKDISGHLYFFQRNGIGEIDVQRESLITDNTGNDLQLGTGDLFSQYRYLTTSAGTSNKFSVIKGERAIYLYDTINKRIGAINPAGYNDLSSVKHISKYLNSLITTDYADGDSFSTDKYVVAGVDPDDNNIYFTFCQPSGDGKSFTISYNEREGEFVGLHSFIPRLYTSNDNRFLSIVDGVSRDDDGWLHTEDSKRCTYYSESAVDTILTFIVADNPALAKIFDAIEYDHYIYDSSTGSVLTNNTFSEIIVDNSINTVSSSSVNAKYKFRTWRINFPRDTYNGRKVRFTGKYAKITVKYDNDGNKELVLYPIVTHWRPVNISLKK